MAGMLVKGRTAQADAGLEMWFVGLPALVYGVVLVVKVVMGSVDVGELEGLRYGYKGA